MSRRLKVLVVDASPPIGTTQGLNLIGHHLFPRLAREHDLSLICRARGAGRNRAVAELASTFVGLTVVPDSRHVPALLGWFEPFLARVPVPLRRPLDLVASRQLSHELQKAISSERWDVIHVRNLAMAGHVGQLPAGHGLLELIDSASLHFARAGAGGLGRFLRRLLATVLERYSVARFDACTTVSPSDAAHLRKLVPHGRVQVIPNGVDVDYFHPFPGEHGAQGPKSDQLVFVGAMDYRPNVAAVKWFCSAVLPRIREARPGVRFVIGGRDPGPEVRALASADQGIEVTGTVDDVRPYLWNGTVFVAPMVSGSGIKNKVLEAMAAGLPVVSTRLGVEAITIQDGRHAVVADGAASFADAVIDLLESPDRRRELASAALQLVRSAYTWDACAAAYARLYQSLAASNT